MDMESTMTPSAVNSTSPSSGSGLSTSTGYITIIQVVYLVGIAGNALAIITLRTGERRLRNRKHLLLLTSLAANDLVALVGMLGALLVSQARPQWRGSRGMCAARVLLRVFGVGSVCIAVTMALERCVALTRPFLYQKKVTYYMIRSALLGSWLLAAALTLAPVLGLGAYYDEQRAQCTRYRNAEKPLDFIYAIVYVTFGSALCVVLVCCNLAVIRQMFVLAGPRAALRRVSRRSCRAAAAAAAAASATHNGTHNSTHNAATPDEVAFSRLMATLSVFFIICWPPQMVMSALYLALGPAWWGRLERLAKLADMLMLLNYVLDPVLYVLLRRPPELWAALVRCCSNKGHKTSNESRTSCCPQETLMVSESGAGGAELRPLRV